MLRLKGRLALSCSWLKRKCLAAILLYIPIEIDTIWLQVGLGKRGKALLECKGVIKTFFNSRRILCCRLVSSSLSESVWVKPT